MSEKPYLKDVLPTLASMIKERLTKEGLGSLAASVEQIRIVKLCECNEPDCGSFYTSDFNLDEDLPVQGYILRTGEVVEIMDGRIAFVEIMPSREGARVRKLIKSVFSDNQDV